MSKNLSPQSSTGAQQDAAEAVFALLSDFLFERVNLLTHPNNVNSTATTTTTTFTLGLRIPDTAGGFMTRPDRKARFRTIFYVSGGGMEKSEFYFLVPARYQAESFSGADLTKIDFLHSFVGIWCNAGVVKLVSRKAGVTNVTDTSILLSGTTTYVLEVLFNIYSAEFFINGQSIGSISCNLLDDLYNIVSIFPFFAPIRSKDGTSVNLNVENYQFLQDK